MSDLITLGDVLLGIEAGKSFQTSERRADENELGVLKVSAVTWSAFRPDEAKSVNDYEPEEHHRVRSGDLLISRANTRELVGAVVLVEKDYPFRLLSDKTLRLIVDTERAEKSYLLYALRSAEAREHIEHFATGTSDSMRNIAQGVITSIPITLPHIVTQRRIAARLKAQLAAVEEARQAAEEEAKEVKALRLAIYREAFADIVPVGVPPVFDVAPDGWRWAKLSDLARLESGHTPSRPRSDWWGGNISWVSLTEIRALDGRWVDGTQIKTNEKGIANSAARILPRGTVCFSRTASVGFVTIMGQPMATSQDFANWVCDDDLDPDFLMHALIRARTELRALATGATHKTIYMPTLQAFHICLPDRSRQERIVKLLKAQLAATEQIREAVSTSYAEIERLPARMLAQAFEES
ncbi:MAG: restriction endonuclease subunit S [Nitrospirota bacterium]|nr:restriction endonuclease subunit S [Nitrospirota bacterium]